MRKSVTVAVIGAGQAGLAVGYYLTRAGIDNVIIDAAPAVGDSWRNRWDTLRLFTPAKYDSLPGLPFPAPAGSFPTKDQTAAYLQDYAEHHNLRTRLGHRVDRLRRDGMGFVLTVDNETVHATYVVVATGAHQTKRVPPIATGLDETIHQVHAGDYRNPGQLRPGPVLVVGAGNSGTELAIEAANAGHQTYLAGKSTGQMPQVARLFDGWLFWFLATRVFSLDNPIGRKIRPRAQTHGGPLIRLTAKDAKFAGVESVGRVVATQNGRPTLADGRQIEAANVLWSGPRHCLPGRYLTRDTTRSGSLLMRRQAAAMLVAPCRRWRLTARLRSVAITCGPWPVRIWEWSSAKVTSRIQCSRFSMDQCPRIASASSAAVVSS